ncbi:MAG TPA: hypothetical protein VKU41_32525 [Polyangiaceae bacterium]|nr:hypothetical protein [Polyangiaceae bacterium]
MKWVCALLCAWSVACRFGGPSSNPDEYVALLDAAMQDASAFATPVEGDDGGSTPATGASNAPGADESSAPDQGDSGAADDSSAADDATEAGACSSSVAVCDPIHNTGCNAIQQCDVDPAHVDAPTGQCLLDFGGIEAAPCAASFLWASCPPHSTCVSGACRQLCFCNADCPAGQCCSDTSGPRGFSLCHACP